MEPISRSLLLGPLLALFCHSASAASVQISIANVSPSDSIGFEAVFHENPAFQLTDVTLNTTVGGSMALFPILTLQLGLSMPMAVFPPTGFGSVLPLIGPGDSLLLTLDGVDFTLERALQFGVSLFTESLFADAGGNLTSFTRLVTAGEVAEFADDGNGNLLLVIPGGPPGGPTGITPSTNVLAITAVPEPSGAIFGIASGIVFTLRRRRR